MKYHFFIILGYQVVFYGGVAEWLNAPVLKTGMGESPSWVRIPPPPPLYRIKTTHYDALCISFLKVYYYKQTAQV